MAPRTLADLRRTRDDETQLAKIAEIGDEIHTARALVTTLRDSLDWEDERHNTTRRVLRVIDQHLERAAQVL